MSDVQAMFYCLTEISPFSDNQPGWNIRELTVNGIDGRPVKRSDDIPGAGSRGCLVTDSMIGLVTGLMREILDLEQHRGIGDRAQGLVEKGRVMATPKIQLAEEGPSMGRHRVTGQIGVMGENEFAVRTTSNVDLDGVGHRGRRHQSTECVVREPGGPAPVTDYG